MIIGFDIDDTITRHPEFFSLITHALINAHHEVVIITFREDPQAAQTDLNLWNIAYSKLITSSLDDCFEHGVNEWKAVVCRRHAIEIFFEDDPDVIKHVDESTICMMPVDKTIHKLIKIEGVESAYINKE